VLAKLFYLTGKAAYREQAERQITAFSGEVARNPLAHAALMSGAMLLESPVQIVLIGDPASADLGALRQAALAAALPQAVVLSMPAETALPPGHPAFGKGQIDHRATAYVCPGQTCRTPVAEAAELAALLATERQPTG
jgi:uncharacterized protein YyaL (SSP411 family)